MTSLADEERKRSVFLHSSRLRIELQESSRRVAGASRDLAGIRPIGDAKQQADHQVSPEQPGELFGHFSGGPAKESGRLGLNHYFPQGDTACLAADGVQGSRYLGRA